MKLIHRIGYYLLGLSVGLVFLTFFLKGKDVGCDYSPNARVKKNIRIKPHVYADEVKTEMQNQELDSTMISYLLFHGKVDFSESNTNLDVCNIYVIKGKKEDKQLYMKVENCPELATILELKVE
ncbi:MAG TPA: hypothetical protein VFD80_05160 [Flavobacteriaceae bacterium]|nr:hypothetical protein [Flavobacteriaceae bacterium]